MALVRYDVLAIAPVALGTALAIALLARIPRGTIPVTPLDHGATDAVLYTPRPPTPTPLPVRAPSVPEPAGDEPASESGGVEDDIDSTAIEFHSEGEWTGCDGYFGDDMYDGYGDEADFQRWLYDYRRDVADRWAAIRAARSRPAFNFLAPGNSGTGTAGETRFDPCGFFPRACVHTAGGTVAARTTVPASVPADTERRGSTWLLSNEATVIAVDITRLCALTATRRGETEHPAITFVTPTDANGCTVVAHGVPTGAALAITWVGNGWSQRAIVSLEDDADAPDATVTLVRDVGGGHHATWLANLSAQPMVWAIHGGRELSVDRGTVARVLH